MAEVISAWLIKITTIKNKRWLDSSIRGWDAITWIDLKVCPIVHKDENMTFYMNYIDTTFNKSASTINQFVPAQYQRLIMKDCIRNIIFFKFLSWIMIVQLRNFERLFLLLSTDVLSIRKPPSGLCNSSFSTGFWKVNNYWSASFDWQMRGNAKPVWEFVITRQN